MKDGLVATLAMLTLNILDVPGQPDKVIIEACDRKCVQLLIDRAALDEPTAITAIQQFLLDKTK